MLACLIANIEQYQIMHISTSAVKISAPFRAQALYIANISSLAVPLPQTLSCQRLLYLRAARCPGKCFKINSYQCKLPLGKLMPMLAADGAAFD